MRASANRVAAARGGWWRHAFRGGFFDFIYVIIEVIGTCMQNFKKIDLKKNSTFFNQSCSALFLLQTVLIFVPMMSCKHTIQVCCCCRRRFWALLMDCCCCCQSSIDAASTPGQSAFASRMKNAWAAKVPNVTLFIPIRFFETHTDFPLIL